MGNSSYSVQSLRDAVQTIQNSDSCKIEISDDLGCSQTSVVYYNVHNGESAKLPYRPESVCIPLNGAGILTTDQSYPVATNSIAYVPPDTDCQFRSDTTTTWMVVNVDPNGVEDGSLTSLYLDQIDFQTPDTSPVDTAHLTSPLGCQGMKVNLRRLEPGQRIPYHTEGDQEELFVPLDGSGEIRIDGSTYHLDSGDIARVHPDIPRGAINNDDEPRIWFMVGAPPTGDPRGWDPGAEYADWPTAE